MQTFRQAVRGAISYAAEVATEHLGEEYSVTLIFHTDEGEPSESVVASTGDKPSAIPPLTAAATGSEEMEPTV